MSPLRAYDLPVGNNDMGAAGRGLRVIIAGAGGAAHLPGMIAAATPLPVIGVPRPLDRLDGLDSLLSIVQMPAGVPVATVSIDGGRNAGLLAVRILAAAEEGWSGPGLDERIHHLMAHWPDVKLHWYGKGQRPGRKLGHVTALGEDLEQVRARAVAAARYLADGVVDPAFAFDEEH